MKAMILAAGEGTRLRPLTSTLPKPMVPIAGVPLLAHTLRWLAGEEITDAAVNLCHRPDVIADFFGDRYAGIRLHYFREDRLRGTAGGVRAASALLEDAPFCVIYGDNLVRADLRRLRRTHQAHRGAATLALFRHPQPSSAGIVGTEEDGRITRFVEKPPPDQVFSDQANAGLYILEPSLLAAISPALPLDFGRDVFPDLLARGVALYGAPLHGYIQDTGTPDGYRQANWDMLDGRVDGRLPATLQAGAGARLGEDVRLHGRNVLGEDVTIGDRATLTDCILWDGVRIGSDAVLERAVLGRRAVVAPGCRVPPGALLGDDERAGFAPS